MCHRGSFQSDGIAYTFSNGSAYPTNSQGPPLSQYAIVPNYCQVGDWGGGPPLGAAAGSRAWTMGGKQIRLSGYHLTHHLFLPFPKTVDNWGTYATQCAVPGYGAPSLFIYNNNVLAPTSYPVTYDQKAACNLNIFTSNLVDKADSTIIYGKVRD